MFWTKNNSGYWLNQSEADPRSLCRNLIVLFMTSFYSILLFLSFCITTTTIVIIIIIITKEEQKGRLSCLQLPESKFL